MRAYIAGPMRGHEHYNYPAFDAAAELLRAQGHEVFNPAENDRQNGFDAMGLQGHEAAEHGFDLRIALKEDLAWICDNADAVVVLDGWCHSRGAKAEVALADALGLPVHFINDFKQQGAA